MIKSINTIENALQPPTDLHHRYFHQDTASEKQLAAAQIKAAAQLKDATKLGTILKKTGGGLSRHRH